MANEQNTQKKYASLSSLQAFLDNIKNIFAPITHTHKVSELSDYTVDTELSSESANPVQNKVLDAEFEAIGTAMSALELAIDNVKIEASNQDAVVLIEAQTSAKNYTDTAVSGKADAVHTHAVGDVTGLDTALSGKADATHGHAIADVDGLQTALDGKTDSTHSHNDLYYTENEADTLLATKADATHNHDNAYDAVGSAAKALEDAKTYADTAVSGKADASHNHAIADVTGLDTALDDKAALSHTHKISELTDYTVDTELSPTSTNPVQNKVINAEFEAMTAAIDTLEATVEEILSGGEEEFSVTGELVKFDLDIEEDTELQVISKIHRDETWGESNKLVLHQVSGTNFVDLSSYLGGAGKVYEKNGLTGTINEDCTLTVTGTNTSTGWTNVFKITNYNSDYGKRVYPAGTYRIPSGLSIQVRAAQYPEEVTITGLTGNLENKFVATQPFRVFMMFYAVAGSKTVDATIPLGLFRDSIPETGYEYTGNVYAATFDNAIYEGEYNWTTGELKDADGNTVSYYESQSIKKLSGTNYFWTGFGENTISNISENNLEKVVVRLGEAAPDETVPSICDFTLTPSTPQATYCLHSRKVLPGGTAEFYGQEIPLITTKGTLAVVDAQGKVTLEKYIDSLINWQGATDVLTNRGIHKVWSEKFYFTKEPVAQEDFSYGTASNSLYTFEFTEEDFQNTGLPAKLDNIPIVSPCFYTGADAAKKLTSRVWGDGIFPATLSWDGVSGKYIFKVRGLNSGSIMPQLQMYTKGYLHYQLETPYDIATTVALGISNGDMVTFTVDDSDWKTYLDAGLYKDSSSTNITEVDAAPTGFVYIPRNAVDACDGMINAARMLNNSGSAGGDATVQGYSWIGEGDGVTDYTSKIQSKLDELHLVSNGGTIHLGSGTYPISGSLLVYGNTRIIGNGQTVIEQTADNTHALVLCGDRIAIEDLSIKLSGACTEVTACVYANSNNKSSESNYNSNFPETYHVEDVTIDNVLMSGKYKFGSENGYPVVSDAYENYMGVGIYSNRLYFIYAHVDNVHFEYLHAGVHGGGGSNYFNVTSEYCKYGLYIRKAGDNTYFVNGHSYYAIDENGNYITMSDAIAYVENDTFSTYHLRTYDCQAYNKLVFLGEKSRSNKIDCQTSLSTTHGFYEDHEWDILKYLIIDYGRGNCYDYSLKNTPYHIGSESVTISRGEQLEQINPVIQNALSGAGIWGSVSSNVEFSNFGISLRDVCRYPSEKTFVSKRLPYILSTEQPTESNPIEIVIDLSNRPVVGGLNYFIQFDSNYVASDYVVSFDTTNTGEYGDDIVVTNNTNITEFYDFPQVGKIFTTYRMKFRFTKPLQIANLQESMRDKVFDYNPDGLIGICNIGMTVNDYAGRSFLGECGGSLYGNVDMHQNTLKNLPAPVDAGDAVSKAYLEDAITGEKVEGKVYTINGVEVTAGEGAEVFNDCENNIASGKWSHAEGGYGSVNGKTVASGTAAHAEGSQTTASGEISHAEGCWTTASGEASHSEGELTQATGRYSHAEGLSCKSIGDASHAEGISCEAQGEASHAEGYEAIASGQYAHAENRGTASGNCSHAEGKGTASGHYSHAEGFGNTASNLYDHAEGVNNTASGGASHAEGSNNIVSGDSSHVEGAYNVAEGTASHAEGYYTKAASGYQHVQGKFNIADTQNKYAHIVGNGEGDTTRSNAHTIDWNGNAWFAGDVYVGGSGQDDTAAAKLVKTTDSIVLPPVTAADNGKVLMVVNGVWTPVSLNLSVDENGVISVQGVNAL